LSLTAQVSFETFFTSRFTIVGRLFSSLSYHELSVLCGATSYLFRTSLSGYELVIKIYKE